MTAEPIPTREQMREILRDPEALEKLVAPETHKIGPYHKLAEPHKLEVMRKWGLPGIIYPKILKQYPIPPKEVPITPFFNLKPREVLPYLKNNIGIDNTVKLLKNIQNRYWIYGIETSRILGHAFVFYTIFGYLTHRRGHQMMYYQYDFELRKYEQELKAKEERDKHRVPKEKKPADDFFGFSSP